MWNRAKQLIILQIPKIERRVGFFPVSGTQLSTFHGSHSRFTHLSVILATASFSSIRQPPLGTSSTAAAMTHEEGGVERTIREKLLTSLSPVTHLTILNESHRHNVPANSETHFKVVIVTPIFDTVPTLVARHRLVNTILADELSQSGPIHALSIVAKTPAQWIQQKQQTNGTIVEPSPPCLGGDGSLPPKNTK